MNELVLVVDDEKEIVKLARDYLERAGFRVLSAGDGEEAVAAIEAHDAPFDLLLCDVVLPGANGPRVHERLCELQPDLPVIYMSGYVGDILRQHGVDTDLAQRSCSRT